ncbi:MAG: hypothetical protein LUQ40_00435 [Methanomicrobiales archaeon]|nr:hypothetical protein [Methanomicrobiales archaeon]
MKIKIMMVLLLLALLGGVVQAADFPNLPPGTGVELDVVAFGDLQPLPWPLWYLQEQFTGIPDGFDIADGNVYDGWCADPDTGIALSHEYDVVNFYNSYDAPDSLFPASIAGPVNYIINNKANYPGVTLSEIQATIWYFTNGIDLTSGSYKGLNWDPVLANQIKNDAVANGDTFVPSSGDVILIIVEANKQVSPYDPTQLTMIELTVPDFQGHTPGFWKNHPEAWNGYAPSDLVTDVFSVPAGLYGSGKKDMKSSDTLIQALAYEGGSGDAGGARILLRAATAGLLNAADPDMNYRYSETYIITAVNQALTGDRDSMIALAADLDAWNNAGFP